MSWLTNPMLGLRLETIGWNMDLTIPVAFGLVWIDNGEVVKQRGALINPQVPIPAADSKVHGITDAMVEQKGGDLWRSIEGIFGFLKEASDDGAPLVGIQLRWDLAVIDSFLKQAHEGKGMRELGWDGMVLDAHTLDRSLDAFRKGDRHPAALCRHYNVAGGTHQPVADAISAYRVLTRITQLNPGVLEESLPDLYVQQQLAHKEWVESFSRWRVKKGRTPLEAGEFGWPLEGDPIRVKGGTPKESDLLVTDGQRTSLILRVKETLKIEKRDERMYVIGQLIDRDVLSYGAVTQGEYHQAIAYLKSIEGTAMPATLAAQAKTAVGKGYTPEAAFEAEVEPIDTTGVSADDLKVVLQKVMMEMFTDELDEWLKKLSLPVSGKVKDRRLRLYERALQLRAQSDAAVADLFA